MLLKVKTEGVAVVLPDLQQLGRWPGRSRCGSVPRLPWPFDEAIRTAKTMFAMARHLGEHPTFTGSLVGIPIANAAIAPWRDARQPGCPNLFWALTNLPSPLVPLEKGWKASGCWWLAVPQSGRHRPMNRDQLEKYIAFVDLLLGRAAAQAGQRARAWLDARTKDEKALRAARRRLVEYGLPEERLRRFPAEQVLLLDEQREYRSAVTTSSN